MILCAIIEAVDKNRIEKVYIKLPKPAEEENKPVAEPKQEVGSQSQPEPQIVEPKVKEETVEQEVKEEKGVEESHEDEVFTINRPAFTSNINVVGKIDLDALNQQTRPKKKTKEEKRKERESKEKQRQESHKAAGGDDANQQGGERRKRQRISKEKGRYIEKHFIDGWTTLPWRKMVKITEEIDRINKNNVL